MLLVSKRESPSFEAQDPLEEVNLGTETNVRMTKINGLLVNNDKIWLIQLIKQYKDWFARDYHEMTWLSRNLVDHKLPTKASFKPHQKPPKHCNPQVLPQIKAEIEKMLGVRFIWTTR